MITGSTINNGDIQLWENNVVQRTIDGSFTSVATNGAYVFGLQNGNVHIYQVKEKNKSTDTMKSFPANKIKTVSVGRGAISVSCGGGSESFQVHYDDGRTLVKNSSGSEMKGLTSAVLNELSSKNVESDEPVLESSQSNPTDEVNEEMVQHFDSKLSEVWYILKKSCRTKQHWALTTIAAIFSAAVVYGISSVSFATWRGDNVWIALLSTSVSAIFMGLTYNLTAQIVKRTWYGLPAVILSLFIMVKVNNIAGLVCIVASFGLWCWPAWPFVALFFLVLGKIAANYKGGDSHMFGTKMAGR